MAVRNQHASHSRSWWEGAVAEWSQGCASEEEFCRRRSIGVSTFRWWRSRLVPRRTGSRSAQPKNAVGRERASQPAPLFIPVRITRPVPDSTPGDFEVVLLGGRRIRVPARFDQEALASLVSILESVRCS